MTSNLNHHIICNYFADNNYFGYPSHEIFFFEQGLLPCFSFDNTIIVESEQSLSLAPDGNGGIYNALKNSGAIDDMEARGVEGLHVYGIDNILTKSVDPLFIGLCVKQNIQCANKVRIHFKILYDEY
jgi:UDP-N-acetylglucosamine/UDP-N-acetylgalactosamine diphosphorylase